MVLALLALATLALPVCQSAGEAVPAQPPAIEGRVVDPRGRPLAGVPVRMYAGMATRWKTGETVTDKDGRFAFMEALGSQIGNERAGTWDAYVGLSAGRERGGNPAEYLPWRDVRVPPGECVYVELVYDQAAVDAWVAAREAGWDKALAQPAE